MNYCQTVIILLFVAPLHLPWTPARRLKAAGREGGGLYKSDREGRMQGKIDTNKHIYLLIRKNGSPLKLSVTIAHSKSSLFVLKRL